MGHAPVDSLAGWKRAYLGVASILTGLWIAAYFLFQSSSRSLKITLTTLVSTLALTWAPLVAQQLGLRASSSISAALVSMMYIGSALYSIMVPGAIRLLALFYLSLAVFYYFGSTKTWQAYEQFWLMESRRTTESKKS